jgi:CRISPR-associated protein Cas2
MYIVVCYDVVEDRRRGRLMKRLRGWLTHVQKSVFEGEIDDPELIKLRSTVLEEINPAVDTVRIFHLCARCIPGTEVLGTGSYVDISDTDEIV